jgi:structural maintenance of chromosome 4
LADITNITLNDRPDTPSSLQGSPDAKTADLAVEKPVDIVLRTRSLAIPHVEEPSGPRPRIVITHLVLLNFKSYAGRQEVGPFHASFSSVVGPNGSGKSNVIDSLLFVFGFRASKMRQGKISALIHNSAAHPNLEYCEVEVHFQEVIDLVCAVSGSGMD